MHDTASETELLCWYSLQALFGLRVSALCSHQLHQCTLITMLSELPACDAGNSCCPAFQRNSTACQQSSCPLSSINLVKVWPRIIYWSVMHLMHLIPPESVPGVALVVLLGVSSVSSSISFGLGEAERCPHSLALLQQAWTLLR